MNYFSIVLAAPFLRLWACVTLVSAMVVSTIDALLLERSRGLFTGGFLSVDHLSGFAEVVAFVIASIVIDVAVAGLLAAAAMSILARWSVSRAAAVAGGVIAAAGPLLVADVLIYELGRYLGAGFDLALMFDLTGRSVAEFVAVAADHLWLPTLALAGLAAAAGGFLWVINRMPGRRAPVASVSALMAPVAVAVAGTMTLVAAVSASDGLSNGLLRKPSGQALQFVVTLLSDVDRDGFGIIGRLADPDPFNREVFPYAVDVPGNGVDENGVAGDLPAQAEPYPELPLSDHRFARTPDVVLVMLESFRADLVGAQLHGQPITPVMNALAARGLAAPRAYSHNGYTVQSRFHLLAGTLVAAPDTPTLLDDFKANGYVTGYFSGQDESFGSREYRVGFDRADVSFDARSAIERRSSTFTTPGSLAVPHDVVQEQIDQYLIERGNDPRPLFLYVSLEDTHFPYSHSGIETVVSDIRLSRNQITPDRRERLWASYANTAANIDRALGVLLDGVRRARGREPAVIVTADHGESLFDDGFLGHGHGLNDIQTRVPLIVVNLPMRLPDPFSQIDLRSALTQALTVPEEHSGHPSLAATDRPVLQYLGDLRRPRQVAFLQHGKRFIYDFRTGRAQTWDGESHAPEALGSADSDTFRRLVHHWEWINRALRSGSREP